MKIGYARVSTEDQRLTLQLDALKQAGSGKVFREKVSGAYRDRPELNRILDQLREGGVVTVWKLDRLARSTRDLLEIVEAIRQAGARFQSISEPWADTTTHAGKMIMTIFAGIAVFERDLIRERTGAGRADAWKRGVRFGRPKKMNEDQLKLARRLLKEGKSVRDVASASASTLQPIQNPYACGLNTQQPAQHRQIALVTAMLMLGSPHDDGLIIEIIEQSSRVVFSLDELQHNYATPEERDGEPLE